MATTREKIAAGKRGREMMLAGATNEEIHQAVGIAIGNIRQWRATMAYWKGQQDVVQDFTGLRPCGRESAIMRRCSHHHQCASGAHCKAVRA